MTIPSSMQREEIIKLFEFGELSHEEIARRMALLDTIDAKIGELMRKIREFKGMVLHGSILDKRFRWVKEGDVKESDIDGFPFWKGYNPRKFKWVYYEYIPLESYIVNVLWETTERLVSTPFDTLYIDDCPKEIGSGERNVIYAGAPFGVFLGDESYIHEYRKAMIDAVEQSRRVRQWPQVQEDFLKWKHNDLSNPDGNYALSDFVQLRKQYPA